MRQTACFQLEFVFVLPMDLDLCFSVGVLSSVLLYRGQEGFCANA